MKVRIVHKNKNLEVVGENIYDLAYYCQKMARDINDILDYIDLLMNAAQESGDTVDALYEKVRHKVFDISGAVYRLPNDIEV